MTLFLLVSTARERSFTKAPALSNIGSMSPARLSLSTVASPHCRLLFHLAAGILAENQPRLSGQPRTKRLSSLPGGWKSSDCSTSGRGRNISLDIPLYRTGVNTTVRLLFAFFGGLECHGEFSPTGNICHLIRLRGSHRVFRSRPSHLGTMNSCA